MEREARQRHAGQDFKSFRHQFPPSPIDGGTGGENLRCAASRRERGVFRCVILFGTLCLVLTACGAPIGAVRADPREVQQDIARSALTSSKPSVPAYNALSEHGLLDAYERNPESAITELHRIMVEERGNPDLLFALAELSFLYGKQAKKSDYNLAAAIYAYAFLFPEGIGEAPGRFDPRLRLAAELYKWGVTKVFASEDKSEIIPQGGMFTLPFGQVVVAYDAAAARAGDRELYRFVPSSELMVYGLAMRYRTAGIGVPLAASTKPIDVSRPDQSLVAPRLKVPLTLLLRIPGARRDLIERRPLAGRVELHLAWDEESISIAGEKVPLENEPTAALAHTFTDFPLMNLELLGLLGQLPAEWKNRPPLVSTSPYHPGLIPVVFVHGTASSPVRWAEMYNRLISDHQLRSRYQFWVFSYDSGNPVALSSLRLREALTDAIKRLDPDGKDPSLRQMVLIGHSQGGLLVKMQAISTGDQLWNAVSRKPLQDLDLKDETRQLLQKGLFIEPLPEVSRVVFVATPHRGSYVAKWKFVGNLLRRLLTPSPVTGAVAGDILRNQDAMVGLPVLPTAVDNMSPDHPFIKGLQTIPVASSIKAHSIIAVEGDGPVEQGADGVVEYSSAHIDGVESELVVRSGHSTQGNPQTIEEVRRILLLHAGVE